MENKKQYMKMNPMWLAFIVVVMLNVGIFICVSIHLKNSSNGKRTNGTEVQR